VRGLVEYQDLIVAQQRLREPESLHISLRQCLYFFVAVLAKTEQLDHEVDAPWNLGAQEFLPASRSAPAPYRTPFWIDGDQLGQVADPVALDVMFAPAVP